MSEHPEDKLARVEAKVDALETKIVSRRQYALFLAIVFGFVLLVAELVD